MTAVPVIPQGGRAGPAFSGDLASELGRLADVAAACEWEATVEALLRAGGREC